MNVQKSLASLTGFQKLSILLVAVLLTSLLLIVPMLQHQQHSQQHATSTDFITVCGSVLCLHGREWYLYGGSRNGGTIATDAMMDIAVQGHLNIVRLTDWLDANAYDETRWRLVDAMIAAAQARNMYILLDLSTYRNLTSQSGNPYLVDWNPFLHFVLNRVNTVSGETYKD